MERAERRMSVLMAWKGTPFWASRIPMRMVPRSLGAAAATARSMAATDAMAVDLLRSMMMGNVI